MSDPSTATRPEQTDMTWMHRALELAALGRGRVEPNPMVGCVVVQDGIEVASGFHQVFGGPHAEVHALSGCDPSVLARSTVYVTLEPCSHHGKTPPCVDLLLARPPSRVVIAMLDPFPGVSGRGLAALQRAGIATTVGVLEPEARWLNGPYLKRLATGLPWVIAKWAMTLDGAIATQSGDSKWITGPEARDFSHGVRAGMDAIVVGSETVLMDDPLLTARPTDPAAPIRRCVRVVLDRRFRIPIDCRLVRTAGNVPTLLVARRNELEGQLGKRRAIEALGVEILELPLEVEVEPVQWLTQELGRRGATNVLVEGGGRVLGGFFDAGVVDQIDCYVAAKVLGAELGRRPVSGTDRIEMNQARTLHRRTVMQLGPDLLIRGYVDNAPAERSANGVTG